MGAAHGAGFLTGLKKRGHTVEVLERVRQVEPRGEGAKGTYSVYRVRDAALANSAA